MASGAVNLYEFLDFFKIAYTNDSDLLNLGKILSGNNLIYSNFELTEVTTFTPAVKIKWVERNSSGYYNARLFQINFYDYYHLNLIYSTDVCELSFDHDLRGTIPLNDELWKTLINEYPKFYMSLTVYECDGDIDNYGNDNFFVTSVESEFMLYDTNSICYNISRNSVLENSVSIGTCNWYRFIAPATEEYTFAVTTPMDTSIEIFSEIAVGKSIENRLDFCNYLGGFGKCEVTRTVNKYETIYIRVRHINWSSSGGYTLSVLTRNHIHSYNHTYTSTSSGSHKSYCVCGDYVTESHKFQSLPFGARCIYCSYFTKFAPEQIHSVLPPIDNEINVCYNENEDD